MIQISRAKHNELLAERRRARYLKRVRAHTQAVGVRLTRREQIRLVDRLKIGLTERQLALVVAVYLAEINRGA